MDNSPQKIGKGMIAAAWILALLMLAWWFGQQMQEQRNPNRQVRSSGGETRQVVLRGNAQGHYLASGEINGEPVEFLLDTGATMVSIPQAVADRLKLEKGPPLESSTANGTITTYFTRLDRVRLGSIELENVRASINPHMEGPEILLGMSFLRKLEFTQRDNELILKQ
jgi:aspartyl protease family protein